MNRACEPLAVDLHGPTFDQAGNAESVALALCCSPSCRHDCLMPLYPVRVIISSLSWRCSIRTYPLDTAFVELRDACAELSPSRDVIPGFTASTSVVLGCMDEAGLLNSRSVQDLFAGVQSQ